MTLRWMPQISVLVREGDLEFMYSLQGEPLLLYCVLLTKDFIQHNVDETGHHYPDFSKDDTSFVMQTVLQRCLG